VPVAEQAVDDAFEQLLAYLRTQRGVDLTGYKRPSLTRLVTRRMRVVGVEDFPSYVDHLQAEPAELTALLDALLINVTAFFRDDAPWDVLRHELLPPVLAGLKPHEPVRIWSAACASGEEAYSLAILLHELLGDEQFKARVKVYATDIDNDALATARAGWYPAAALEAVSAERRSTYFVAENGGYRFRPDLRQSLIFGRHDLLQDAPISRVLLLSCRNVLMYFTPDRQTRVLERFAFALHESGLLLLGKAEMLLTQSQLFAPVSLPHRVFRPQARASARRLTALAVGAARGSDERRILQAAFAAAPTGQVVLDDTGMVVSMNDRARLDLLPDADGLDRPFAELDVASIPLELRGAVTAVQAGGAPVDLRDLEWVRPGADGTFWDVRVAPLEDSGQLLGVHLVFEDAGERHELQRRLHTVQSELTAAYEELQSSSEELETTNEELQSAIEELETTNEELQSTNEELETMNEELQSTNEELQTLNDELRERTLEINQANGFLNGVLEGVDLAVAVVDANYRVQLWNPAAERLTGLRAFEAQGLPLMELDLDLPLDELRAALRGAGHHNGDGTVVEADISNRFGKPVRRRLLAAPLRSGTDADSLRGVVVTLADVPA